MFLAGESIETARSAPNADDLERQAAEGCYWWAGLDWFIRCDDCGIVTEYRKPDVIQTAEDRAAFDVVWIAWEADAGGGHRCREGCAARDEQLALTLA